MTPLERFVEEMVRAVAKYIYLQGLRISAAGLA